MFDIGFDIGKDLQNAFDDGYRQRDAEIVRCKDCKFNYANQIPSDDVCQLCVELPITKDFFCAYGEKMDEVEDGVNR